MGEEKACRDRIFSVATGLAASCHDLGFWFTTRLGLCACHDKHAPSVQQQSA